jgi:predicted Zn-dependent protease
MIVQDNSLNAFVAGGQRIFINTGLIMRTERPNQLIGVLAHETGHIAGGHLARMQEEMRSSARCRSSRRCSGAAPWRRARVGGSGVGGRPADAAAAARRLAAVFLQYTQTQESSADQAAISYLERTHQSVKGTIEFSCASCSSRSA